MKGTRSFSALCKGREPGGSARCPRAGTFSLAVAGAALSHPGSASVWEALEGA